MQNPKGGAQMNGREEATRLSAWQLAMRLSRKRGKSRVSATCW